VNILLTSGFLIADTNEHIEATKADVVRLLIDQVIGRVSFIWPRLNYTAPYPGSDSFVSGGRYVTGLLYTAVRPH
jgi:hypothetical protein